MPENAINNKLQCSVATYLRCDGVANDQIKKGSLLSLSVEKLKLPNIWQSYKQALGCLVHVLHLFSSVVVVARLTT